MPFAENKQISVSDSNGTIGEYSYDGDGKRIKKFVPSTGEVTVFIYDAGSKLIGEYSTVVQTGTNAKTVYTTNDALGSPRINTDATGQVISRHDYHPFGEEIVTLGDRTSGQGYVVDYVRRKFSFYQRDDELDLDYARLRMYANKLGRFTGVDPVAADIYTSPSLNRYQYCLNNPLRFIDAGGGYDEEVHRDLTAALAFVVGFSEEQGNSIGNADQDVDISHNPEGVFSIKAYNDRVSYHFTTSNTRSGLRSIFEDRAGSGDGGAFAALGTYLHAEQDSFSHAGFEPIVGQGSALFDNFSLLTSNWNSMEKEARKYDLTTNDPAKAVQMARDTLAKLLAARNLLVRSGKFGTFRQPVPWEQDKFINDKLLEWAKTDGRDAKRNILFEIMNYVTHYWDSQQQEKRKKKKRTKTTVRVLEEGEEVE